MINHDTDVGKGFIEYLAMGRCGITSPSQRMTPGLQISRLLLTLSGTKSTLVACHGIAKLEGSCTHGSWDSLGQRFEILDAKSEGPMTGRLIS